MGAEVGSLPGLGAFSHMGGSACGATAHDDGHGAVHDTFMTLPPYTRTSEGEVHELGLGVRNCSHRALSDPLSETSESIERPVKHFSRRDSALRIPRETRSKEISLVLVLKKKPELYPEVCRLGVPTGVNYLLR